MNGRPNHALAAVMLAALLGCFVGCSGDDLAPPNTPSGTNPNDAAHALTAVVSGARRLTRTEYDDTLRDLLGDTTNSGFATLPEDVNDPFDNNYTTQLVSPALIEAAETLATDAARRALADKATHDRIIPCQPTGPGDTDCLKKFITTFGRRALRRPLAQDEIDQYATLSAYAVEGNSFDLGVELVLRAMLQDLEFLYRVEVGTEVAGVPGTFKLSSFEVATRLSYFLWGTTPDDPLLELAAADKLGSPEDIRAAAVTMMADPRARDRVNRFHALWLSFHQLPHPPDLTEAMRMETGALINRVVFDKPSSYFDLFTASDTYLNDFLADHYGMPRPGTTTGAWVPYGSTGRKGILSHGSVLSAGAKFADTSPTQRGKFVQNRLLCREIPPPPPTSKSDNPPSEAPGDCKIDKYKAHSTDGACKGCHSQMDPIGFGLENYDNAGVYRATELDKPECPIDGNGELVGVGTFNGPAGLADQLLASGQLETCVVTQLYRFAIGRREGIDDTTILQDLGAKFKSNDHAFANVMIELVAAPGFGFRKAQ
jgi:hypothetical protein